MPDINATNPVVVPATGSVTYDKWYLTQIIAKIGPDSAPLVVHLNRASKDADGNWTLMSRSEGKNEVAFTLDVWKELAGTPEIGAAIDAVLSAVVVYATKKKLI